MPFTYLVFRQYIQDHKEILSRRLATSQAIRSIPALHAVRDVLREHSSDAQYINRFDDIYHRRLLIPKTDDKLNR